MRQAILLQKFYEFSVSALQKATSQLRAPADLGQPSPTTVVSQPVDSLFTGLL